MNFLMMNDEVVDKVCVVVAVVVSVESTGEASSTASTTASALASLPASVSPDPVVVVTNLDVRAFTMTTKASIKTSMLRGMYYYSNNHFLLCRVVNAREIQNAI